MNNEQKRVVYCGCAVILLMGLFPPWLRISGSTLNSAPWLAVESGRLPANESEPVPFTFEQHDGYAFLFSSRIQYVGGGGSDSESAEGSESTGYSYSQYQPRKVDCPLLLVQWFLVSAVTGIIVLSFGNHSPTRSEQLDAELQKMDK